MKIPFITAKDAETGIQHSGFYFEYPETTYCFSEDYNKSPKCKLIPCIVTHRMSDWGLSNVPQLVRPIDKSTLKIVGYVDTEKEFYFPDSYLKNTED